MNPTCCIVRWLLPSIALIPLAAQQREPQPSAAPAAAGSAAAPANRYGFADWRADWPVALELPQPSPAATYDRSRRQAIERVVANLQGNCRREVWQMATEFFWRAPDDAVEPLIAAMDRAFGTPIADVVRNAVDAMGKMGREEFDDALRRALEHPSQPVRQAAFTSLTTSGRTETVRWCAQFFRQMDGRGRQGWLRAARLRLGDEAVELFTRLMVAETPGPLRDQVLKETEQMPPAQAARVLAALWPEAVGEFKAIIAGFLHAAGDAAGTVWLRDALAEKNHEIVVRALKQLVRGSLGELREPVLALSLHPRPEVRLAVANLLRMYDGKDIENVYEVLSRPEEMVDIKCIALRELTRRGRTDAVTALLEDVRVVTGTRLELQLNLLVASGDERAVPIFVERFRKSPAGEGREFLRALAICNAPGSEQALLTIFREPERRIDLRGETTVSYIPVVLPNLRGREAALLAAFPTLDRGDPIRRSHYLQALSAIASDRTDPAVRQPIEDLLRAVALDRNELPQLRIQALQSLLTKAITIDDAMQLKRRLQSDAPDSKEAPPMRAYLRDLLNEYF